MDCWQPAAAFGHAAQGQTLVPGLVAAIMGIGKANQYEARRNDYARRRAAMVQRLDTMRRS
jgi:hypothetical protein